MVAGLVAEERRVGSSRVRAVRCHLDVDSTPYLSTSGDDKGCSYGSSGAVCYVLCCVLCYCTDK